MTSPAGDFRPSAAWPVLELRARLLAQTRRFFDERGFVEVETPILSAETVIDRHLEPFQTRLEAGSQSRRLFLQTSPEFAMKRLLAAGAAAIYQITRAFRQGEIGARHNPEFTIVEWYRVGDDYAAGMQLLDELCVALLHRGMAERLTYRDAFLSRLGLDPHQATIAAMKQAGESCGLVPPESFGDDRDAWLDWLLTERIEPTLGIASPVLLCDYPASQAALARLRNEPYGAVAERCELYVDGLELANGYHELLDPAVLRERNQVNNRARAADGREPLPEESLLLAAMESGLPPCMGVAMGFDRVVMLAAGAATIQQVQAFPIDRA